MSIDPIGKFAYVANFGSNDVAAYSIDATSGALKKVKGSPFLAGTGSYSVAVESSGKFAYAANLGSDNVSAYAIDANSGALTPVNGSPFKAALEPISIAIDPTGKFAYVANYGSNNVSAYTISTTLGALTPIKGSPFAAGSIPLAWRCTPRASSPMWRPTDPITSTALPLTRQRRAKAAAGIAVWEGYGPQDMVIAPTGTFAFVPNGPSKPSPLIFCLCRRLDQRRTDAGRWVAI